MPQGVRVQGYSKNPGSQQVTSKGARESVIGGKGTGKGDSNNVRVLPQPQNGKYSAKNAGTQQLRPGRHPQADAYSDYAGDGKSYGAGGNQKLRNPATSSAFDKPEYPGDKPD